MPPSKVPNIIANIFLEFETLNTSVSVSLFEFKVAMDDIIKLGTTAIKTIESVNPLGNTNITKAMPIIDPRSPAINTKNFYYAPTNYLKN